MRVAPWLGGGLGIWLAMIPMPLLASEPPSSAPAAGAQVLRGPGGEGLPAARQRAEVADVFATATGDHVVVLRTLTAPVRYLPLWIGPSEALAIQLRLDQSRSRRPLTLELVESALSLARMRVTEVVIHDVRRGMFLGRVMLARAAGSSERRAAGTASKVPGAAGEALEALRDVGGKVQGKRTEEARLVEIDARPSDAIGLALGQGVPIWVHEGVLQHAGFDARVLRRFLEAPPSDGPGGGAGGAGGAGPESRGAPAPYLPRRPEPPHGGPADGDAGGDEAGITL